MWRVFRLLLSLLPAVSRAYEVVEIVEGRLAADEANHYTVRTTGVLVVALVTQEGDADLYASVDVKDPGYGNSQFSSSSCGLDLIVVPWKDESRDSRHIYLSVVGHGRHQESQYKLYVITPANDDITKYQVWDWDPETGRNVLLVDYDPLEIANDHTLHQLLEQLRQNAVVPAAGVWLTIEHITEWVLYLSLETLKIMIEIFL